MQEKKLQEFSSNVDFNFLAKAARDRRMIDNSNAFKVELGAMPKMAGRSTGCANFCPLQTLIVKTGVECLFKFVTSGALRRIALLVRLIYSLHWRGAPCHLRQSSAFVAETHQKSGLP